MQWNEYVEEASRTKPDLGTKQLNNFHMLMGMVTEVGELLDAFKKDLAYNKVIDWINVKEELGDLMWYVAGFCKDNNFDLEKILENNIKKLRTRYPEKFSEDKAINRNLSDERSVLEEMRDS